MVSAKKTADVIGTRNTSLIANFNKCVIYYAFQ